MTSNPVGDRTNVECLAETTEVNMWYSLDKETRYESETIYLFGNEIQVERYKRDHCIFQSIAPCGWFDPEKYDLDKRRVILKDLYPQLEN